MDITKKLPKNRVITMLQYKDHVTDDSLTRVSIYIDHVNPKHRMDTMSNWIEFDIKSGGSSRLKGFFLFLPSILLLRQYTPIIEFFVVLNFSAIIENGNIFTSCNFLISFI